MRLILASGSPRRRTLLSLLGVEFEEFGSDVDETLLPGEPPAVAAQRLAVEKAARARLGDALVLGADTVVVLDGKALGKPADPAECREMLLALRGRAHDVVTGVALMEGARLAWLDAVRTTVIMRAFGLDELESYVATGRGLDKAGGYAIQDPEFRPVERIEGCYPNVVGLPLCAVVRALRSVGLHVRFDASGLEPPCVLCHLARAAYQA